MNTSHGHHIPGTTMTAHIGERARCGGVGLCRVCSTEAWQKRIGATEDWMNRISADQKDQDDEQSNPTVSQ